MDKQWKVVPVEPTPQMLFAARVADREYQALMGVSDPIGVGAYSHYTAMLAAAPQPPSASDDFLTVLDRALADAHGAGTRDVEFDMLAAKRHVSAALAPSPAVDAAKRRTLQEQIRDAKAEVAAWDPDRRAAVVLQGPRDVHPPSRECMCAACRPSFDNGADDPAQRYDIARGVTAGRSEWMAEAKRLVFRLMQSANVDGAGQTPQVPVDDAKAALLDHISTHPAQRGTNG